MAFSANFTFAKLHHDGTLRVEGTSEPVGGAGQLMATLVWKDEICPPVFADDPGGNAWTVHFPPAATPFTSGESVFLVGVAVSAEGGRLVWRGSGPITDVTATPIMLQEPKDP